MRKASQGDIFQAAPRTQLTIVFGHIGFNEMHLRWVAFAQGQAKLSHARDPFQELGGRAIEWSSGRWLWFVPEEENHGMTETQLANTFDTALAWASRNGIVSVATNGVANIDRGHDTAANRRSDENRAAWIKAYAMQAETKYNVTIKLISLNDVFVRVRE